MPCLREGRARSGSRAATARTLDARAPRAPAARAPSARCAPPRGSRCGAARGHPPSMPRPRDARRAPSREERAGQRTPSRLIRSRPTVPAAGVRLPRASPPACPCEEPPCPATPTSVSRRSTTRSCCSRSRTRYMHVASTLIFEAGPLRRPEGGIDFEAIAARRRPRCTLIPRYRQKLKYIPLESHPVWVDDDRFNLDYHVRHTALPRPGQRRAAEGALRAHHAAAPRPLAAALGDVGRRGSRGRPLRADLEGPPLHDRRRLRASTC